MRFGMLGPLRVWDGAAWTGVRAAQPRLLLAVLLIEAGQVVSTERLVDELWGERPPRAAVSALRGYVRRLRQLLGGGPGGPLMTRERGYELVVAEGEMDAHTFGLLAESGRCSLAAGDHEAGVGRLDEGLALWRGPALADVPDSSAVASWTAQMERARLDALEQRLGGLLELGRHDEVVPELQRLVAEHPLRRAGDPVRVPATGPADRGRQPGRPPPHLHRRLRRRAGHRRPAGRARIGMDGDVPTGVSAAFDHSYAGLPAEARRLFRLLGWSLVRTSPQRPPRPSPTSRSPGPPGSWTG